MNSILWVSAKMNRKLLKYKKLGIAFTGFDVTTRQEKGISILAFDREFIQFSENSVSHCYFNAIQQNLGIAPRDYGSVEVVGR